MNNEKNSISSDNNTLEIPLQTVDLSTPTTKVLAIGRWTEKGMVLNDRLPIMAREVPATVRLYLTGKLEMWYVKPDLSGPVFILNVTDTDAARSLLEALPLGVAEMMAFDYIPLGPITPLRLLLQDEVAA
jgi:hypothetical protein